MNWSVKPLAALLIVFVVILAGCTGALSDDPDGDEIADKIQERHEDLDDVQGEQVVETTRDGETSRVTYTVWEQPPENKRQEVIEADADGRSVGDVIVRNEDEFVIYDSTANEFTRTDLSDVDAPGRYDSEAIDRLLEQYDIERTGTETVADRETYVLELTPTNDTDDGPQSMTLWIDTEYWYPLQQEFTDEFDGETIQVTTAFTEVAFNEGVDDDRFTFDPPAGAEENEFEVPETEEFADVETAADATPFDLSEPTPPDGYELDSVNVIEYDNETRLTATYDGENILTFSVGENNDRPDDETGDPVEIGDIDGERYEEYGMTQLVWECNGNVYAVSGGAEKAELLAFAESIGCE